MKYRWRFFGIGGAAVFALLLIAEAIKDYAESSVIASEISYVASVSAFFYVILLLISLVDVYLFDEFEFWEKIAENPIAVALVFLGLCILGHASITKAQPHVELAKTYVGIREATGRNDGADVERMLRRFGGRKGDSWCSAFVGEILDSTEKLVGRRVFPLRLGRGTLLARSWVRGNSIRARDVLLGRASVPAGAIVIWEKGETIFGHCGFVTKWQGARGETIEGNTGAGDGRRDWNGDGVYERRRQIVPTAYFRITTFTPVTIGG